MGRTTRNDDVVFKVSVARPEHTDSRNYYYANRDTAFVKANEAKDEGTLLFFGEYHLVREFEQ